jgi:prepilin-type N-terminal cleavage/methylation domain-containing protein
VTPRWRETAGFTLTEMLVSVAIGGVILAALLTSFIMCQRSLLAISNYWQIHADGRVAIDRFAADMRQVSAVTSFNSNSTLVVVIPTNFTSNGTIQGSKTVTYSYGGGALKRTDSTTGLTTVLATNIYSLGFRLYDKVTSNTTVLSTAKGVQMELFLRLYTAGQAQTEDYLSARLVLRNTP